MRAHTHHLQLQIRALIYKEDEQYVAHALEMDILAYADTEEAAISELKSLVESQILFARSKQDEGLLLHPAPKEFFERWERAQAAALRREVLQEKSAQLKCRAIMISVERPVSNRQFHQLSCAEPA